VFPLVEIRALLTLNAASLLVMLRRGYSRPPPDLQLEIATLITEMLRNPAKPQFCVSAFCRAFVRVRLGPTWETQMRVQFHDMLTVALVFIGNPLNDYGASALEDLWSKPCKCDQENRLVVLLHVPISGETETSYTFTHSIMLVIDLLSEAIQAIPANRLDGAGKKKWPDSRAALLPHGPGNMLESVLLWIKRGTAKGSTQTLPIYLIASVLHFCPSLIKPILQSMELRQSVLEQLRRLAHATALQDGFQEKPFPRYDQSAYHLNVFFGALCLHTTQSEHRAYWGSLYYEIGLEMESLLDSLRHRIEIEDPDLRRHLLKHFTHYSARFQRQSDEDIDYPGSQILRDWILG